MEVLVISSYPEKAQIHGEKTVGVGNYTKATLLALIKAYPDMNLRVWSEIFDQPESYLENKIEVDRCWKRGSFFSVVKLFKRACKDPAKVILLPFETMMFGSLQHTALALILALFLKLKGKKIVLVLHHVLGGSIKTFARNPIKAAFLTSIRRLFLWYLTFISYRAVVFEQEFKERLGSKQKVIVIPHAVIQDPHIDKAVAREKLGLDQDKQYVMYFGFLAVYKGIQELLRIWEPLENVELIIAGGSNPNYLDDKYYKSFVEETMKMAKEKGAITPGFVPEDQLLHYFCAVDVMVLPYTVFMASSGPLSHAFSQGLAVMFSNPLRGYFNSEDMKRELDKADISIDEICFDLDKPVKNKILWALHNQEKLERFSKAMCKARSWSTLSHEYYKVLAEAHRKSDD